MTESGDSDEDDEEVHVAPEEEYNEGSRGSCGRNMKRGGGVGDGCVCGGMKREKKSVKKKTLRHRGGLCRRIWQGKLRTG